MRERLQIAVRAEAVLEIGDLGEFELQIISSGRRVQFGGIMRIMRMHRRHDVAFDQPRTSAQQRDQALMIVLVEHRLLLVFRIPLAEPGNGHSITPTGTWPLKRLTAST